MHRRLDQYLDDLHAAPAEMQRSLDMLAQLRGGPAECGMRLACLPNKALQLLRLQREGGVRAAIGTAKCYMLLNYTSTERACGDSDASAERMIGKADMDIE